MNIRSKIDLWSWNGFSAVSPPPSKPAKVDLVLSWAEGVAAHNRELRTKLRATTQSATADEWPARAFIIGEVAEDARFTFKTEGDELAPGA